MLKRMTEPPYSGSEGAAPPPGYPPPYQPQGAYPNGGYPPPPYQPGGQYDPSAPFGRHRMTGEPLSDKSKIVAGLLQLLGLFGFVGMGRIYLGQIGLGITQLVVGLVTCGIGAVIWGAIDAVLILSGQVRDPQGRPLRDDV
jgi:TM2 domain-containing membrane protein YozV